MKRLEMKIGGLAGVFLSALLFIALIESVWGPEKKGSLLFILLFWLTLLQGAVALAAAAQLSKAKWILPIKKELLSLHPLLLLIFFLFLLFGIQLDIYPWVGDQGIWLNKKFFMLRNLSFLLLIYLFARKFAIEVFRDGDKQNIYALLYLFTFVTSQTLAAFDWVMSLEYPWYSTLFGGYFFIEALYTGTALACILCYFLLKERDPGQTQTLKKTHKDAASLLFAFSVMWGYFFFSQFIVIWYGNLPEEVTFFVRRFSDPTLLTFSFLILAALFPLPFLSLLFFRIKSSPFLVLVISFVILSGVFIERLLFLLPLVTIQMPVLVLEFVMMSFLFVLTFVNRDQVINHYALK